MWQAGRTAGERERQEKVNSPGTEGEARRARECQSQTQLLGVALIFLTLVLAPIFPGVSSINGKNEREREREIAL